MIKEAVPYDSALLNSRAVQCVLRQDPNGFARLRAQHPGWKPKFRNMNLAGCCLDGFVFDGSTFKHVSFCDAHGTQVSFIGCRFKDCAFIRADLSDASFVHAYIEDCDFSQASFKRVTFETARITSCVFLKLALATPPIEGYNLVLTRALLAETNVDANIFDASVVADYADFQEYNLYLLSDKDPDGENGNGMRTIPISYFFSPRDPGYFNLQDRACILPTLEKAFSQLHWKTLLHSGAACVRSERLPNAPKISLDRPRSAPPQALSMPAEAAVRMASKECLKACTDVIVQGVGQLPIAPEHRESLTKFLRNSKGQVLVAQMLALLLGSGVVDHLPLLTEEMKDVLRTHLPQELRVSTIAQGIEEVMNLLSARLLDILRGLNLGIEASKPAPSPPPPAALPEPPAKLPKPAARQKARVQR